MYCFENIYYKDTILKSVYAITCAIRLDDDWSIILRLHGGALFKLNDDKNISFGIRDLDRGRSYRVNLTNILFFSSHLELQCDRRSIQSGDFIHFRNHFIVAPLGVLALLDFIDKEYYESAYYLFKAIFMPDMKVSYDGDYIHVSSESFAGRDHWYPCKDIEGFKRLYLKLKLIYYNEVGRGEYTGYMESLGYSF